MNITVKHIEELVKVHEKKFRVEELNGKFKITIIRDYENRKFSYDLHRILSQRISPIEKLTETLSSFIPEDLFVIKEKEINIPLSKIDTDYYVTGGTLNYRTYGMSIDVALNDYTTYVDINSL